MGKRTVVVSSFPFCGQDTAMLGLKEMGYKVTYVPMNKENKSDVSAVVSGIGKYDVIFTIGEPDVRNGLRQNNIKYIAVYPALEMRAEIEKRVGADGRPLSAVAAFMSQYERAIVDEMQECSQLCFLTPVAEDGYRHTACFSKVLSEAEPVLTTDFLLSVLSEENRNMYRLWWNFSNEVRSK